MRAWCACMGKGSKERLVPLGEEAVRLDRALREAGATGAGGKREPDALFITARGAGMTRQAFWHLIRRYGARAHSRQDALAARAAPRLRHASHQPRRRPARGADAARPRRHLDDADLHARGARAPEAAARQAPSARMKTPATEFLGEHGVAYTEHEYEYVEHGGTAVSSSVARRAGARGGEDAGDGGRSRRSRSSC